MSEGNFIIAFNTVDMYKGREYQICVTGFDEAGNAQTFDLPNPNETVYNALKSLLRHLRTVGKAHTEDFGKSYLVKGEN